MKHLISNEDISLLTKGAIEIGVSVQRSQIELLCGHLALVLEANETTNLTRITDWSEALRLHVLDSLLCVPELQQAPTGAFIDIGTGGGFPGIPVSIASNRTGVLLDSVKKKAALVSEMVAKLGLSDRLTVVSERAEEHAARGQAYSAVLARAVSSLPSLVELASPLLDRGGVLVALKARMSLEERERGDVAAAKVGMRLKGIRTATLPFGEELRSIIVYEKVGKSSLRLPRRAGLAQHSPLA